MTNREAHEQAAGMPLEPMFFSRNGIDPDAEYVEPEPCNCESVCEHELDLGLKHPAPAVLSPEREKIVAEMGFAICEFGPHENDDCECECELKGIVPGPVSRQILEIMGGR